jgi:amphi-Trp domain-containing protein
MEEQEQTMKAAANDIVVQAATPVTQVIGYLEQLVHALKVGAVHVRHGDYEVVLGSRDVVDLSVVAKARNKRQRLSLELTWRKKSRFPDDELELAFAPDWSVREAPVVAAEGEADVPVEPSEA